MKGFLKNMPVRGMKTDMVWFAEMAAASISVLVKPAKLFGFVFGVGSCVASSATLTSQTVLLLMQNHQRHPSLTLWPQSRNAARRPSWRRLCVPLQ